MEIAAYACGAIGMILAVVIGILLHNKQSSYVIWTTFSLVVIAALGVCLSWQNIVWKNQAAAIAAQEKNKANAVTKLSDEDIQKIVDGVAQKLIESDQAGDAVFGVRNKRIFPAKDQEAGNLQIKWETGRIVKETKDKITIKFPTIIAYDFGIFENNLVTLHKRVGNKQCPYLIDSAMICVEVVEIRNGVTMFRVSIVPTSEK